MNDQQRSGAAELTDEQLAELKTAARAATQGIWNVAKRGMGVVTGGPIVQFTNGSSQQQIAMFCGQDWMRDDERDANAAYAVAGRPEILLALIDRLERAESALAASPSNQPAAAPLDSMPSPVWWINYGSYGQITTRSDEAERARDAGASVHEYHAIPAPTPADERAALSEQDIYDKFSFLEGLVNESTYVRIADTAIEIARATKTVGQRTDAPLSLISHLVARDEQAVSVALLDMTDAMSTWRAEAGRYREISSHDQSAFCDGYEAGIAAILSARATSANDTGAEGAKPALPIEGWYVEVAANGERMLCISDDHVAGLDDMEPFAPIVRTAAAHLINFVGAGPSHVGALVALAHTSADTRPTDDELWDQTLSERDTYHEYADKLANAIATHLGVDIGEHSNLNNPWFKALEAIESRSPAMAAEVVAMRVGTAEVESGRVRSYTFEQTDTPDGRYSLYTAPAPAGAVAIPAGWKAMPPSATTAMRMAMAKAAAEYMQRTGGNSPDVIYEAGFAAAPQPALAAVSQTFDAWYADPARKVYVDDKESARTGWQAALATRDAGMTDAARDVLAERRRQIEAEGWTPEHDDAHTGGQMAIAAGYYALACGFPHERDIGRGLVPSYWPWDKSWWKPTTSRRNLVKAAALALAEIERLDRALLNGANHAD